MIGGNYLRRSYALTRSALRGDREGCLNNLADSVVQTPNFGKRATSARPISDQWKQRHGIDQALRIDVGRPAKPDTPSTEASLAVWIVDPKMDSTRPRGTIIVLHGYRDGPDWMLHKARGLAKAGFRAVVVSMRGHARSTGDYHTFGVQEKQDVSQVIDALEARDLIEGKLGVWGVSYGSTTSLETAAIDQRIEAVVAMAGFSSMRGVTPHYLRVLAPFLALTTSEAYLQKVITRAGRTAGFNPDQASAAEAMGHIHAPVLIIHGKRDWLVPVHHAHTLYAASTGQTTLCLIPWAGHIAVMLDPGGRFTRRAHAWFERHLVEPHTAPSHHQAPPVHAGLLQPIK